MKKISRCLAITGLMIFVVLFSRAAENAQPVAPVPEKETKTVSNPKVVIETSMGNITVELFQDKAPISVKNFLDYVAVNHYDNLIFHRVIPDFMIQGGGFSADFNKPATNAPIKNEAGNGVSNKRGTLAMARTNVVDSATDQFFINVKDNIFLDHRDERMSGFGYAVFGQVVEGMDVVDKIKAVATGTKTVMGMPFQDVPLQPVLIKTIRLVTEDDKKTK